MKPVVPGRRDQVRSRSRLSDREQNLSGQGSAEINADELREFLEADLLGSQADPRFKEALRRKLWALVQAQYGAGAGKTRK